MNFSIIPNQQTPKVPEIDDVQSFVLGNKDKILGFLRFAESLTNACGLAANQTNLEKDRFMLRLFALMDLKDRSWRIIIDPVIEEYIGYGMFKSEGCLTWVGKQIIAKRNIAIRVSYYEYDGDNLSERKTEVVKGFEAQIWQHEISHLNGVEEQVEELDYKLPKEKDINRNDKCPCESGKKHKHCCLLI